MFKKLPGTRDYRIALTGEIIDLFSRPANLEVKPGSVKLDFFGEETIILKSFLRLLAWYECSHITDLQTNYRFIRFYPTESLSIKVRCGSVMMFSEPVLFKDGFRHIPSFPRYAINIDGVVVDTFDNAVVDKREIDADGYEGVYIYNPDKNGFRWTRIHRLMALAWLPNDDFRNRPIVNHKDGNKVNNRLGNLEWCSHRDNVLHALDAGLSMTRMKMKTRDYLTGEVVVYESTSEMCRKIGTTSVAASAYESKLPGYLFSKRYEIKRFEDETPWFYANLDEKLNAREINPSKAIVTITVVNKDTGKISKFINLKDFRRTYGIWTPRPSVEASLEAFKVKFPNFDVSHCWNSVKGPYRVIDLVTGEARIFSSIQEAALSIGKTRTEIQYDLSRGFKFIYDKAWVIIPRMGNFVKEEYRDKKKKTVSVVAVKQSDGSREVFDSMVEAARQTKVDYKTVMCNLDTGKFFKGIEYRSLEP
jgi:hypothetical protein